MHVRGILYTTMRRGQVKISQYWKKTLSLVYRPIILEVLRTGTNLLAGLAARPINILKAGGG